MKLKKFVCTECIKVRGSDLEYCPYLHEEKIEVCGREEQVKLSAPTAKEKEVDGKINS